MANYKRPVPHVAGAGSGYALEKYKHVYLPLWAYGGFYAAAIDSDGTVATEDAVVGAGSGNPSVGEVTDSGICGVHIDAAADDVRLVWPIPFDLDVKYDVEFRVHWSSGSTTSTDEFTWKVLYTELTPNTTAIDAISTALSTAIASDTDVGTKDAYQITAWGKIAGGTLTNERVLLLLVELDSTDATVASEECYAYYLEIRYVRRAL